MITMNSVTVLKEFWPWKHTNLVSNFPEFKNILWFLLGILRCLSAMNKSSCSNAMVSWTKLPVCFKDHPIVKFTFWLALFCTSSSQVWLLHWEELSTKTEVGRKRNFLPLLFIFYVKQPMGCIDIHSLHYFLSWIHDCFHKIILLISLSRNHINQGLNP